MKIKTLLLGAAAGLAAVSAAQAADTVVTVTAPTAPAPTEPVVNYVRVCDTYGAGYFYIPGSEANCLKLIGSVNLYAVYDSDGADADLSENDSTQWYQTAQFGFAGAGRSDAFGEYYARLVFDYDTRQGNIAIANGNGNFPFVRLGYLYAGTRGASLLNYGGGYAGSGTAAVSASGYRINISAVPQFQFGNVSSGLPSASRNQFQRFEFGNGVYVGAAVQVPQGDLAPDYGNDGRITGDLEHLGAPDLAAAIGWGQENGTVTDAKLGVIYSDLYDGWGVNAGLTLGFGDSFDARITAGWMSEIANYIADLGDLPDGTDAWYVTGGTHLELNDALEFNTTLGYAGIDGFQDRWLAAGELIYTGIDNITLRTQLTYRNVGPNDGFTLEADVSYASPDRVGMNSRFTAALRTNTQFSPDFVYEQMTDTLTATYRFNPALSATATADFTFGPDFDYQRTVLSGGLTYAPPGTGVTFSGNVRWTLPATGADDVTATLRAGYEF